MVCLGIQVAGVGPALALGRAWGAAVEAAVVTNVSPLLS